MTVLFWTSGLLLFYAFIGYPVMLAIGAFLARDARRTWEWTSETPDDALPSVSILLSVYNEEAVIERKIVNFLMLDYPEDRIELCIVSDGSTDATDEIIRQCGCPRVRLFRRDDRGGKTRALNFAASQANGELLVFTDANAMFRADCVRRLVERFEEPEVGLVSGVSVYIGADGTETTSGLYRRYEEWLKQHESDLFSIAGADGAVYALRRELYAPLRPEYINDLLHPVQVVLRGLRAVTEPRAVVEEDAVDDDRGGAEMRRQTRIMAQAWLICLRTLPALEREGRWGFIWQIVSHKVLRWLTLPLLILLAVSAFALQGHGTVYALVLTGLAGGGLIAGLGAGGRGGISRVAWLFLVLHAAAVVGLLRIWQGETFVTWNPRGN